MAVSGEQRSRKRLWLAIATFGGAAAGSALLGSMFTPAQPETRQWYSQLSKPPFNPPDFVFAPVWTVLYVLITMSAVRVWRSNAGEARTTALRFWGAQMALNAAWSPLFFGARQPGWALVDLALLVPAIVVYIRQAHRVDSPAAYMMWPYLGWVMFATVLNAEIVRRNLDAGAG
jgi:benzodiazapine receptor